MEAHVRTYDYSKKGRGCQPALLGVYNLAYMTRVHVRVCVYYLK